MTTSHWRVAAASVTGSSHRADGRPCQDAHDHAFVSRPEGDVLVAAVSDGAGSAPLSDRGSALAVRALVAAVSAHVVRKGVDGITRDHAVRWFAQVAASVAALARSEQGVVDDYACTLMLAVVGPDRAVFAQVGDGATVLSDGSGNWTWAAWPQHGEYANMTSFVTSCDVAGTLAFGNVTSSVDEVALFTDGIENLVLRIAERRVHAPFFEGVLAPLRRSDGVGNDVALSEALERHLASSRFDERSDDDRTLLMATRRPVVP